LNAKLTDADLMVLVTALFNKLNYPDTTTACTDIEILIDHLDRAPGVNLPSDAAVFLARQELSRGLNRSASVRICNAISRHLIRTR
jgi:hypothetical protein